MLSSAPSRGGWQKKIDSSHGNGYGETPHPPIHLLLRQSTPIEKGFTLFILLPLSVVTTIYRNLPPGAVPITIYSRK